MTLGDGRSLAWAEYGSPGGRPLFYCHGLPASRLEAALVAEAAAIEGVRLIAPDRPGCGRSDPAPGRTLLDWPRDLAALADALGVRRFAVLGVSGGGPYALACALALASRLTAVGIVGSLGPNPGRMLRGPHRWSFALARRSSRLVSLLARHPAAVLALLTAGAPRADRVLLRAPEVRAALLASIAEAGRQGSAGITHDLAVLAGPWGFAPEEVAAEVLLWHGEADATVPCSMGRALAAALATCRAHFLPGEGHFSLPVGRAGELLRTLTRQSIL